MRRGLLLVLAGCGSSSPPPASPSPAPAPAAAKPAPQAGIVLELVRRPPVGTSWHEVDRYETDSQGTLHHTRHQLLEADVGVVAQVPQQETLDVTITKHESTRDGAADDGLFAPGTKLRVVRQPGACKVSLADGTPVPRAQYTRFTDAFDCNLPRDANDGDDVLFALGEPHRVGSTWQMSASILSEAVGASVDHALATLVRVERVDGRDAYILDAGFTAPSVEVTFHHVVPVDGKLPVLRSESVMRSSHVGAVGTYTTTRTRTPRH